MLFDAIINVPRENMPTSKFFEDFRTPQVEGIHSSEPLTIRR